MIRPDLGSLVSTNRSFGDEIIEAFQHTPKILPQKYLYGEIGDILFQEVMQQPDYYVSRCEYEIIQTQAEKILSGMLAVGKPFNLIDIGAGDGSKTKILISYLYEKGVDFTYVPVDFSSFVLDALASKLLKEMPHLKIKKIAKSYSDAFTDVEWDNTIPNLMIFLGTSFGNLTIEEQDLLLGLIAGSLKKGDQFMLGVDLQKDPEIILKAYRTFDKWNLNYLATMNEKLGADFQQEKFKHYTVYEPLSGSIYEYLMSMENQSVYFSNMEKTIEFESGEPMLVLMSRKYRLSELTKMAHHHKFQVQKHFMDSQKYFVDTLWEMQ